MTSIRTYKGEIRVCTSCGQPAYQAGPDEEAEGHWCHFIEQWDGIHCDYHPLAGDVVEMEWSDFSLEQVKELYNDTSGPAFSG